MSYYIYDEIVDCFEEISFNENLTQSDFSVSLIVNGNISSIPVTISHVENGIYSISFTPDEIGTYSVSVRVIGTTSARYHKSYSISVPILGEDINQSLLYYGDGSLADYINRIKKYTVNRLTVSNEEYTIFEDDGVTEFEKGTLNHTERTPE